MFTTRPEIHGTFGAAASTHWLASQSAMRILELGGNAFDAAFTGGMVLQVVEPHMNGPGGDVPMIYHDASSGSTRVICGQGPLPAAATIDAYRDQGFDLVPGTGLLAAVVPGAFGAWMRMLRDMGSMKLADLMEVPIKYARKGFPITPGVCRTIAASEDTFRKYWPGSEKVYLRDGVPKPGTLFRNKKLAKTWKRIVQEATEMSSDRADQIDHAIHIFYKGFVAEEIDRFCREKVLPDVSGKPHKALLTGDDLYGWSPRYEAPVTYDYHGHTICKCGPWSQGPVLLQSLALLRDIDIASMDPNGPDFVHTVAEAMKLSYADREVFYGDPDFVDVPLDTLLSDDYNSARRTLIGDSASNDFRPGSVHGPGWVFDYNAASNREPEIDLDSEIIGFGSRETNVLKNTPESPHHRSDTCHIDVVDKHGNMISVTPSGGWLQSSPVISSLGFCLGSRAQMAWLDEKSPSAMAPGRRPRTTLTPSFVLRDGEPYMAFGTPGGDQQDQWQLQMLLRHIHHGMNLQEAIDAPAFHIDHFASSFYPRAASPGQLVLEDRFGSKTFAELDRRGHKVFGAGDWSEGRLSAIAVEDGIIKAAANAREMQGYAVGR